MSREMIGGPDGAISTLIIDSDYVSCIDKPPTLEQHQKRRDDEDAKREERLATLTTEMSIRNANDAVETLQRYAAELEPFGTRTMPPPWYARLYWRWVYKLQEIVKIIRE